MARQCAGKVGGGAEWEAYSVRSEVNGEIWCLLQPLPQPPLPGALGMKAGAWPGGSPVWRKGVGRFTQEMEWNDFPWVW